MDMRRIIAIAMGALFFAWSYGADLDFLLSQKVERRLIYQNVIDQFHVKSPDDTVQIRSFLGKPVRSKAIKSPDGSIELHMVLGISSKKTALVIGVYENRRIFMVGAVPSAMPSNLSYAEYPVWIPLNGGRVMWWGLGSRECSIVDVRQVLEDGSVGFFTQEIRTPIFKGFDAMDPALRSIIKPYVFLKVGPDDSADIALFRDGCKLGIKNGFMYSWIKPIEQRQKKPKKP